MSWVWPKDSFQTCSIMQGFMQHCRTVRALAKSRGVTQVLTAFIHGFLRRPQLVCMNMDGRFISSCSMLCLSVLMNAARPPWMLPIHLKEEASVRVNLWDMVVFFCLSSVACCLLSAACDEVYWLM